MAVKDAKFSKNREKRQDIWEKLFLRQKKEDNTVLSTEKREVVNRMN